MENDGGSVKGHKFSMVKSNQAPDDVLERRPAPVAVYRDIVLDSALVRFKDNERFEP